MKPFLFSNSSTKEWTRCRRAFFLGQLAEGTGLSTTTTQEDLLFGSIVHTAVEQAWKGELTPDTLNLHRADLEGKLLSDPNWWTFVTDDGRVKKAAEWGRLLVGMLLVYQRHTLPALKANYHMVMAEADAVRWLSQDMGLIAKPDMILYGETEAAYPGTGYLEFKTVANPDAGWHQQWHNNPQTWTGAMTLEAALGIKMDWFQVCGLVKGTKVADAELGNRRTSPLAWAWRLAPGAKAGVGTKVFDVAHMTPDGAWWSPVGTTAGGWFRKSTDEYPGGLSAWVDNLPQEIINKQVVLTEPVNINWDLAEEWLEGQLPLTFAVNWYRTRLEPPSEVYMRKWFPRELSECNAGKYGKPCVFLDACHNPLVGRSPLTSGKYKRREEHHPLAKKLMEESK